MPSIVVRGPTFFSPQDESAFFIWLQCVPAVRSVRGAGADLIIVMRARGISDASLRELIGLFTRYKLPLRELAQFESPRNSAWLLSPNAHWWRAMFGATGA
jgi:hypothetical protein